MEKSTCSSVLDCVGNNLFLIAGNEAPGGGSEHHEEDQPAQHEAGRGQQARRATGKLLHRVPADKHRVSGKDS